MVKAITFDLWGTLIRSNSNFEKEKLDYFANYSGLKISDVKREFDSVKKGFNENVSLYGMHFPKRYVLETILRRLNCTVEESMTNLLFRHYEKMFLDNKPFLYSDETLETLEKIKRKQIPMYLVSNTLLIEGSILTRVLDKLQIRKYFNYFFYSDEVGFSKPSQKMYDNVFVHINENYSYITTRNLVLHVGNDMVTDYEGAKSYGFQSLLINDPDIHNNHTIKNVLDLL